jgi:hypothetical protein
VLVGRRRLGVGSIAGAADTGAGVGITGAVAGTAGAGSGDGVVPPWLLLNSSLGRRTVSMR